MYFFSIFYMQLVVRLAGGNVDDEPDPSHALLGHVVKHQIIIFQLPLQLLIFLHHGDEIVGLRLCLRLDGLQLRAMLRRERRPLPRRTLERLRVGGRRRLESFQRKQRLRSACMGLAPAGSKRTASVASCSADWLSPSERNAAAQLEYSTENKCFVDASTLELAPVFLASWPG